MSELETEILALEEQLRVAELGPDPKFFEETLANEAVLISENGQESFVKAEVVKAHQPGHDPKFTRVEMSSMKIVDHGAAAVVTCKGTYEGSQGRTTLRFMRVWLKKNNRWQIIAGAVFESGK
jgi:hypothetical protein